LYKTEERIIFVKKQAFYIPLLQMINIPLQLISVLLTDYISQTSCKKEFKVNLSYSNNLMLMIHFINYIILWFVGRLSKST